MASYVLSKLVHCLHQDHLIQVVANQVLDQLQLQLRKQDYFVHQMRDPVLNLKNEHVAYYLRIL